MKSSAASITFFAEQLLNAVRRPEEQGTNTFAATTDGDNAPVITPSPSSSSPHRLCGLLEAYILAFGCCCERRRPRTHYPLAPDSASRKVFEASIDAEYPFCFEAADDGESAPDDGAGTAGRAGGISTVKALLFVMAHMCTSDQWEAEVGAFTEAEAVEIVSAALRQQKTMNRTVRRQHKHEHKESSPTNNMWDEHADKCDISKLQSYLRGEHALSLSVSPIMYALYRLAVFECVATGGVTSLEPRNDRQGIDAMAFPSSVKRKSLLSWVTRTRPPSNGNALITFIHTMVALRIPSIYEEDMFSEFTDGDTDMPPGLERVVTEDDDEWCTLSAPCITTTLNAFGRDLRRIATYRWDPEGEGKRGGFRHPFVERPDVAGNTPLSLVVEPGTESPLWGVMYFLLTACGANPNKGPCDGYNGLQQMLLRFSSFSGTPVPTIEVFALILEAIMDAGADLSAIHERYGSLLQILLSGFFVIPAPIALFFIRKQKQMGVTIDFKVYPSGLSVDTMLMFYVASTVHRELSAQITNSIHIHTFNRRSACRIMDILINDGGIDINAVNSSNNNTEPSEKGGADTKKKSGSSRADEFGGTTALLLACACREGTVRDTLVSHLLRRGANPNLLRWNGAVSSTHLQIPFRKRISIPLLAYIDSFKSLDVVFRHAARLSALETLDAFVAARADFNMSFSHFVERSPVESGFSESITNQPSYKILNDMCRFLPPKVLAAFLTKHGSVFDWSLLKEGQASHPLISLLRRQDTESSNSTISVFESFRKHGALDRPSLIGEGPLFTVPSTSNNESRGSATTWAPDLLSVAMRYASPEVCEYLINIGCVSTAPELVGMLARRCVHGSVSTPLEADQLASRLVTMALDVGYDPSELLVCLTNEAVDLERRETDDENDPFSQHKWIKRLHAALEIHLSGSSRRVGHKHVSRPM